MCSAPKNVRTQDPNDQSDRVFTASEHGVKSEARAKICLKGGSEVDTREKYDTYVNTAFLPAVDPLVIDRA